MFYRTPYDIFWTLRYLNNIPWQNSIFDSSPRKRSPVGMGIDALQSSSDAQTRRAWNKFGTNHVHAGPPANLVRLAAPRTTASISTLLELLHLGGGRGTLLPQGPQSTWTKASKRLLRPFQYFSRFPTRSSFTQTPWRSCPPSSPIGRGVPLYRLAMAPPTHPTRSLRPPPLTPPHHWILAVVKEI